MVTGKTRFVGIIGHPITHTLSPVMHNAAFDAVGLDYCYLPFDVHPRDIGKALAGLGALGCKGLNVTIPHKQAVLPFLHHLSREARLIGAVNTIEFRGSRLIGHNTDGQGFTMAFRREYGVPLKGKRVLLLGAGGAARAVAVQLLVEGVHRLTLTNRTDKKARRLIQDLRKHFPHRKLEVFPLDKRRLAPVVRDVQIIINATSVGMKPIGRSPLPAGLLRPNLIVCDLVYHPPVTALLNEAREAGAKTFNGIGMLLWQGALAFKIWVRKKPPVEAMGRALLKGLRDKHYRF
jgi:shikimate dehydrogenase